MSQPLVYIIIINYNGYKDTIECIKSLKKIKYKNYKIIVLDNDSKDDSEEYLRKSLLGCTIIQTGKNLGFAGANNIGMKYAVNNGADYILLLNNDTIVDRNFLDYLIKGFEISQDIGMVGGKIYYYNEPDKVWYAGGEFDKLRAKGKHYTVDDNCDYKIIDFITGCMQLISVKALKKVGYMNEKFFLYFEDVDYCFRFAKNDYKLLYCSNAKIYHKCGGSASYKSPLSIFYSNRNRYLFINENFKGITSFVMKLIYYFELIIKLIIYKGERKKSIIDVSKYIIKNWK